MSKGFFTDKDNLIERTGAELGDIAINHFEVAIVDVYPVPDTVDDLMNSKVKHVFILEGTNIHGDKIEMMLADTQVEHLGRACSVYVLQETRRNMEELGITDSSDDAISKVIMGIIELMEGIEGLQDDDDA